LKASRGSRLRRPAERPLPSWQIVVVLLTIGVVDDC
jgi:hypothetical protein